MSILDILKSPASSVPAPRNCATKIIDIPDPDRVTIPLEYPGQIIFRPLVQAGDEVARNQVIGRSELGNFIHAPISGNVVELKSIWSSRSFHVPAVVIGRNDMPPILGDEVLRQCDIDPNSATRLDMLRAAGVNSPWTTPGVDDGECDIQDYPEITQIVIKGINQEPTICGFKILLKTRTEEIKEALRCLSEITPQAKVFLTVSKSDAAWATETFADQVTVVPMSDQFHNRLERIVVRRITGVVIPNNAPYRSRGVAVISTEQLLNVYDALEGRPCTHKIVTISAGEEFEPITVRAPLGTSICDILGDRVEVHDGDRVIMGGPMTGHPQYSLETPLSKMQIGIHILRAKDIVDEVNLICVNCGRCVQSCPENLQVHLIGRCVEFNQLAEARNYHPEACIECGLCAFVCPAHRPLLQMVRMANQYGE